MRALSRRAALALAASAFAPRLTRARDGGFGAFLESLWPRARAQGVTRATFDAELMNLSPDPGLMGAGARQAEFERTIKAYIDDAVSAGRVARGQAARARWANALARIERKEGVPAEIILAVWGMETDFGKASAGEKDVIRSLATLAFARGRDDLFDEVIAALVMIQRGLATRARLRGSWAGAMGQPQFLPSAYLKYAVSFGDAGAPDIWTSTEDSLASIAHFLRAQGWAPGQIWGAETKVPTGYDWRTLTGPFASFAAHGFRRADGAALPAAGQATLYLPAGADGPAFLLGDNYWIIKQYNNSDSYAMSVALLGERIAGRPAVRAPWPANFKSLAAPDRIRLQELLRDRGFYDGKIDGRFGPSSRDSIHRYQLSAGLMPADGFASARVLEALKAGR